MKLHISFFLMISLWVGSITLSAQEANRTPVFPYGSESDFGLMNRTADRAPTLSYPLESALGNELYVKTAADWLVSQQDVSGGFPWTVGGAITSNTQGPTARGLLLAYQLTNNPAYLNAAVANGDYLVPTYPRTYTDGDPRFATHDPLFLEQLSAVTADPQYANFVQTYFWDKLSGGTYGETNDQDAAEFAASVVDTRNGWGQVALSPWDLSATAIAAHIAGETAIRDAIMGEVLRGLELTTAGASFDVTGMTGAIWASAETGIDLDPTAGAYASANSTADLVTILTGWTLTSNNGAWLWGSGADPNDPTNGNVQNTAYAVLALNAYDRATYLERIGKGVAFIKGLEESTGEILTSPGASSGSAGGVEVQGEALAAMCDAASSDTYVDASWSGSSPGDVVSGKIFGFDAFSTIVGGMDGVSSSTVHVAAGNYTEQGQIVIARDLAIVGAGAASTTILPSQNTGSSGDDRGWFLVNDGVKFDLSHVTLDGSGYLVYQGIRHKGYGTIDNCAFTGIKYNESGPTYAGVAIAAFGSPAMNVDVTNSTFSEIGRVGVLFFGNGISGSTYSGNTYTGKGAGDWLDYAVEVGAGAVVDITDNDISGNLGVASSDGSTSAGILVTTYYGAGSTANITGSTITGNTTGIAVGYDGSDASTVIAHNNLISGNSSHGVSSTAATVDATDNWWGDASGPYHATGNPSGTGNAVSDNVDFDPWTGKAETVDCTDPATNYDFSNSGVTLNFSALPQGGGEVTIRRYPEAPTGYGNPPGGASFLPLWLDISSTELTNYSFNVTITVDVSGIPGFGSSSQVMYYNSSTGSWVAIGGSYNALAETFTFTTNHFTPYAYVNTPATAYDIFLSQNAAVPTLPSEIYPSDDAGTYGTGDWAWDVQAFSVYIVPEAGSAFMGCDITIQWDNSKIDLTAVVEGDIWAASPYNFYTLPGSNFDLTNTLRINASNLAVPPANVSADGNLYIARLDFSIDTPGMSQIDLVSMDFRDKDNLGVYVTANNAVTKMYLGDVHNGVDGTSGDGEIDFDDLLPFSLAYWSTTTGWSGTEWLPSGTAYKRKYDVGPTAAPGYVYTQPQPDNEIEFEDLMIFSISYGLSQGGIYPKALPSAPIVVDAQWPAGAVSAGAEVRVPVTVSGAVDLRGFSFRFGYNAQGYELVSVEKGELMAAEKSRPVFLQGRAQGSQIWVDGAVVGGEQGGLSGTGSLFTLTLRARQQSAAELSLLSQELRNSWNEVLKSGVGAGLQNGALPTEFAISQNYPNPFNPSTLIRYQLPSAEKVRLVVYNSLGQAVRTLTEGYREAGYYQVEWNGLDDGGQRVSSGIYFYRIQAGKFNASYKMIMMK